MDFVGTPGQSDLLTKIIVCDTFQELHNFWDPFGWLWHRKSKSPLLPRTCNNWNAVAYLFLQHLSLIRKHQMTREVTQAKDSSVWSY